MSGYADGALTYEPEHLGGEVGLLGAPAHTFNLTRTAAIKTRGTLDAANLGDRQVTRGNVVTTMMKADDPLTGVSMRTEIAKNSAPSPLFPSVTIFG